MATYTHIIRRQLKYDHIAPVMEKYAHLAFIGACACESFKVIQGSRHAPGELAAVAERVALTSLGRADRRGVQGKTLAGFDAKARAWRDAPGWRRWSRRARRRWRGVATMILRVADRRGVEGKALAGPDAKARAWRGARAGDNGLDMRAAASSPRRQHPEAWHYRRLPPCQRGALASISRGIRFTLHHRVKLGCGDLERTERALGGIVGKRLTYRDSSCA